MLVVSHLRMTGGIFAIRLCDRHLGKHRLNKHAEARVRLNGSLELLDAWVEFFLGLCVRGVDGVPEPGVQDVVVLWKPLSVSVYISANRFRSMIDVLDHLLGLLVFAVFCWHDR